LLECLVFGAGFAHSDLKLNTYDSVVLGSSEMAVLDMPDWKPQQQAIITIRQSLPDVMWQVAGIVREAASLQAGLEKIKNWQEQFEQLPISKILNTLTVGQVMELPIELSALRLWSETRNLLQVSNLIVQSALFRTESRGGHFRSDFPETASAWERHSLIQSGQWSRSNSSKVLEINQIGS
jgi:L-aspartate oxidase